MLMDKVEIRSISGKSATLVRDELERVKRDMGLERHSFMLVLGPRENDRYYMLSDEIYFDIMCAVDDMRIAKKSITESMGYF